MQGVSTDKQALGFFGLAYYEENKDKLKLVPIDDNNNANGAGPILPSAETVENGTYQPLARPEFIYVNEESAKREEVAAFIHFYINNAPELAAETGAIPLPKEAYAEAIKKFDERITGSMYANESTNVGANLVQLMKKRP